MTRYDNHARMGDYRDALAFAARERGTPDITRTRRVGRVKYGFTLNVEQPLTEDGDTGLFGRFGWDDGATETFAYTEAAALTVDYQFIADPGHNAARGPVSIVSIRLHLERTMSGGGRDALISPTLRKTPRQPGREPHQ